MFILTGCYRRRYARASDKGALEKVISHHAKSLIVLVIVLSLTPAPSSAYSVMSHQAIIDAAWENDLKPALKQRFPNLTDDGLKAGQVVIAAGGALVGRIVEVGPTFAHVALISDPTSTVIGQLLDTGKTGKVLGQLGGALVMLDVDAAAKVTTGQEVFTAGIELEGGVRSPYPKGLLIGRVVDVTRDPNEVVQTVFLEPAAPLDNLEFLLVITDYEGGIIGPIETGVPCDPTQGGTLPDSDQPCPTDKP